MNYEVDLTDFTGRRTAVVAATTTWREFPALWSQLLTEVWDCLRAGGIYHGHRNIMYYLNDLPSVEVGVLLDQPCPLTGRVVASALPAGTVARTVHRGPFAEVGAAHHAIAGWCAARGHRPTDARWEIYGPNDEDPAKQRTEVYWLLSSQSRLKRESRLEARDGLVDGGCSSPRDASADPDGRAQVASASGFRVCHRG